MIKNAFTFCIISILFIFIISCEKDKDETTPDPLPGPVLELGNDTVVINGDPFLLDAGNSGATYAWSTGETTQTIMADVTGSYWVQVTLNDISSSDTIFVEFKLDVDLGGEVPVFGGETAILDAGVSDALYQWSTGETTQTIEAGLGTYWVDVTKNGLSDSDTVVVAEGLKLVHIDTDFGNFLIWLYDQTPLHKSNFITLTEDQFYDGLLFHRVVNEFVIQGGDPEGTGLGGPGYNIQAEFVTELTHVYGAVGAARWPDNVNPDKESNGSQFYIVDDNNGEHGLDGDYTVFGLVIEGMDTVEAISIVPVDGSQKPLEDVVMNEVKVKLFTENQLLDQFGFEIP